MPVITAIVTAAAGFLASVGAGAAALVGVTGLSAITATAIGGALVGAAIGGVTAAVQGESILKGALVGGLMGAAVGGALGWGAQALGAKAIGGVGVESGGLVATGEVTPGIAATAGPAPASAVQGAAEVATGLAPGVTPAATGGAKAAGAGLLSGTSKELIGASIAGGVSSMLAPDEMDILEKQKELRNIEVGSVNRLRPTVDWQRFDYENVVGKNLKGLPDDPTRFSTDNIYRTSTKSVPAAKAEATAALAPKPQQGLITNV